MEFWLFISCLDQGRLVFHQTFPSGGSGVGNAQMIKDPKDEMVNQSFDGLRAMVEAGTGRNNYARRRE